MKISITVKKASISIRFPGPAGIQIHYITFAIGPRIFYFTVIRHFDFALTRYFPSLLPAGYLESLHCINLRLRNCLYKQILLSLYG